MFQLVSLKAESLVRAMVGRLTPRVSYLIKLTNQKRHCQRHSSVSHAQESHWNCASRRLVYSDKYHLRPTHVCLCRHIFVMIFILNVALSKLMTFRYVYRPLCVTIYIEATADAKISLSMKRWRPKAICFFERRLYEVSSSCVFAASYETHTCTSCYVISKRESIYTSNDHGWLMGGVATWEIKGVVGMNLNFDQKLVWLLRLLDFSSISHWIDCRSTPFVCYDWGALEVFRLDRSRLD